MGWVLKQTWEDLLFCHWEAAPEQLRGLIPTGLELDLFNGNAWLTVLPFKVSHQQIRFLPEIPLLNRYLELNVRTYVKLGDTPGVYFFSLDVNHFPTVVGARVASLPYQLEKMSYCRRGHEFIFSSNRMLGDGEFSVKYRAVGETGVRTEPGTLDYWLLERYCLFTAFGPFLLRGDISHESWEFSRVKVEIKGNSVPPFDLAGGPQLVQYCPRKEAFIFPLKKVQRLA